MPSYVLKIARDKRNWKANYFKWGIEQLRPRKAILDTARNTTEALHILRITNTENKVVMLMKYFCVIRKPRILVLLRHCNMKYFVFILILIGEAVD